MNLADHVRRHCEQVCRELRFVEINHGRIANYLASFEAHKPAGPDRNDLMRAGPERERRSLLVLSLAAINFGSGWHDVIAKRPGLSGARSMGSSLTEFEAKRGPLHPTLLCSLDQDRCGEIFGQDKDNPDAWELMGHFSNALGQLGGLIRRIGSAQALIDQSDQSAVALAESLATLETFADAGFFKRAQIAAADLARAGLGDFHDLSNLTAFADNLVPHVLAVDGIISIRADLADQVAKGVLLEPGGRPETELRAAAVHVVELVAQHSRSSPGAYGPMRAMDIDQALWERGGGPDYKQHRRPRCRSLYY